MPLEKCSVKPVRGYVVGCYGAPRDRQKVFLFVGGEPIFVGEPFFAWGWGRPKRNKQTNEQNEQTKKQTNKTNKNKQNKKQTLFFFCEAKDAVCNQEWGSTGHFYFTQQSEASKQQPRKDGDDDERDERCFGCD